jgi:ABC-type nitrate/sulfonate/bicarbonate transport system permease component
MARKVDSSQGSSSHLPAVIGVVVLLCLWELLAVTLLANRHVLATPWQVLAQLWLDRGLYAENLPTTLIEAGEGWLGGNLAALLFAMALIQVPLFEKELLRIAIAAYCMPIVAIGPILMVIFTGTVPKAVLAGLAVFFTTLIAAVLGLRSSDPTIRDVVKVYNGTRWQEMRKVRIPAALPATFGGLQIAAPAAVLGALIGEYLGGTAGIGVAMIISQQTLQLSRTWALAAVASAVAGVAYFLTGVIGRRLTPWAPRSTINPERVVR